LSVLNGSIGVPILAWLLWLDDAPDTETAAPTEIAAFVDRWVSWVNTAVAPGEVLIM